MSAKPKRYVLVLVVVLVSLLTVFPSGIKGASAGKTITEIELLRGPDHDNPEDDPGDDPGDDPTDDSSTTPTKEPPIVVPPSEPVVKKPTLPLTGEMLQPLLLVFIGILVLVTVLGMVMMLRREEQDK